MDGASTFGLWLKQRRKAHDLTQEQLGERVGCAAETIRKFEADARRPSRAMADRLAQVLGVPLAERAALLNWAREKPSAAAPETPAPAPHHELTPLLQIKLAIPRPHPRLVERERLLTRLDAGLAGRITVLVAPPGFGKSTLLAAWLARRMPVHDPAHTIHAAWLTLDAGDNDPQLFLRYLIAALQGIAPALGAHALRLLDSSNQGNERAALPLLMSDLALLPAQSILILDDYHAIETPAIHDMLTLLAERMPPNLHLLIASRTDPPLPLARMRARREASELRAADLRFTPGETASFVQDVMNLPLPPSTIAALEQRTEGWIAGLQLAALSLQGRPAEDSAALVATFAGSHHFVVDYLADEVLAQLPAHIQAFLLQTSILERLCGPLCDAVLGLEADGAESTDAAYSELLLREIEQRNLFLVALDDERRWYRYHQLFADVLRERLARGVARADIAQLHRRAGQWFERHSLHAEAFRHALAAQDWALATRLVEHASSATVLGTMQHHQTLRSWLEALPEQIVRERPRLCLLRARLALLTDVAQASEWARHAEQALESAATPEATANTRGEIAALRTGLAASQGAADEAIQHAQQALADLDAANSGVRSEVMGYLARAYLMQHDPGRAAEAFAEMARLARRGGGDIGTFVPEANLAFLQRLQGQLFLASQTCQRSLEQAAARGVGMAPDAAWVLAARADLLREANDLDAALACASDAVARARQLAVPNLSLLCMLVLARVHTARGDAAQALALAGELRVLGEQFRVVALQPILQAFEAQLAIQSGNLAAAAALAGVESALPQTARYWISPIMVTYSHEHLAIAAAQVLLAQNRASADARHLQQARDLIDSLAAYAEREKLPWLRAKSLALEALADAALGDPSRALTRLSEALELAAAHGFVRVLLDEGAPIAALLTQLAHAEDARTAAHATALLAAF